MGGMVLGMQTMVEKPPATAALLPLSMVSLLSWPGSLKCTCRSMKPGVT